MDILDRGGWRSPSLVEVRAGDAIRRVLRTEVYVGGAWRVGERFIVALAASANPLTVGKAGEEYIQYTSGDPYEGDIYKLNQTQIFTETTAISVVGGASPFTYSWSLVSGTGEIDTPNSAATFFTKSSAAPGTTGLFQCTVTDALGATATVQVTANYF